jgi:hypothetical protein
MLNLKNNFSPNLFQINNSKKTNNKRIKTFSTLILIILLINLNNINCEKNDKNDKTDKNQAPTSELIHEFIPCGKSKCIVSQGYCKEKNSGKNNNEKECVCFEEFGTTENPNYYECNYQKKSQLKAFLLELILSNGAGHFYLENYFWATAKLLVWVITYYSFIVLKITCKSAEDNKKISFLIAALAFFFCIGMLSWQIIDLVFFGLNKYTDGNGVQLRGWSSAGEDS